MRHGKKFNHLGRKSSHRKSMLANMATSLIMHKRITTTLAKAKALRVYVEPLITKSKEDTTHSRRIVFSHLQSKEAVTELFREISSRIAERPGGYTRILKLGQRLGDNSEMAMIELVDFNVNLLGEKETAKAKSTRRGRRGGAGKKKADETVAETAATGKKPKAPKAAPAAEKPGETPSPVAEVETAIPAVADAADTVEETTVEAVSETEETVAQAEEPQVEAGEATDETPGEPGEEEEKKA